MEGSYISRPFLKAMIHALDSTDYTQMSEIDAMVAELVAGRERGGRLFLIGLGGSAANCSHAAADFRTLCDIEAYSFDNLANLTALANDEPWYEVFVQWLEKSNLCRDDLLYVMSVGGGTQEVSQGLVKAMNYARDGETHIIGVAGRDGGALAILADACVIVPKPIDQSLITPITESMQLIIAHLLVSHPMLKRQKTAWEGK